MSLRGRLVPFGRTCLDWVLRLMLAGLFVATLLLGAVTLIGVMPVLGTLLIEITMLTCVAVGDRVEGSTPQAAL